jgi:hypothetical protein
MTPKTTESHIRPVKYLGLIHSAPHVSIFCGRKGSGKTFLLLQLLKDIDGYKNKYQNVIIVSPTFRLQRTWDSISPEGITVYESFSEEILNKIYNEQQPHINSLIILDDNGEDLRRINQKVFNKLISNSRHLNCSIIVLVQKLSQAPTILRSNGDLFACFAATSTRETDILHSEIGILEKKEFHRMFVDATKDQYSCFVVSMQKGKLCFYKNFAKKYVI